MFCASNLLMSRLQSASLVLAALTSEDTLASGLGYCSGSFMAARSCSDLLAHLIQPGIPSISFGLPIFAFVTKVGCRIPATADNYAPIAQPADFCFFLLSVASTITVATLSLFLLFLTSFCQRFHFCLCHRYLNVNFRILVFVAGGSTIGVGSLESSSFFLIQKLFVLHLFYLVTT